MKSVIWGLSLALWAGSAFADVDSFSSEQWTTVQIIDEFTDEIITKSAIFQSDNKSGVVMHCFKDLNSVSLSIYNGPNSSQGELYDARVRIDKNAPFSLPVLTAPNGGSVHMAFNVKHYFESFRSGSNAVIEFQGDNELKLIKFKLNGFAKAYRDVSENCK